MSEFNAGDLVEARKNTARLRGKVVTEYGGLTLDVPEVGWTGSLGRFLTWLQDDGWTLRRIGRALPTEDGFYIVKNDGDSGGLPFYRRRQGTWYAYVSPVNRAPEVRTDKDMRDNADVQNLVRLHA